MRRRLLEANEDLNIGNGNVEIRGGLVGDVLFYDRANDVKGFVSIDLVNEEDFPEKRFKPLGVVAIPYTHNVYGTNEAGVIALNCLNTDSIYDGGEMQGLEYGSPENISPIIESARYYSPNIGAIDNPQTTIQEESGRMGGALPMDGPDPTGVVCPHDKNRKYPKTSLVKLAYPSPYLTDGSRNSWYYQVSPSTNAYAVFDGKERTKLVLNNRGTKNYDTWRPSFGNLDDCMVFSLADMYCPEGTNQGDWYVPTIGEFGYVIASSHAIETSINKIKSIYGFGETLYRDTWYRMFCSSGDDTFFIMTIALDNGYNYYQTVENEPNDMPNGYGRAFIRI